jgi:hypothetical protein
MDFGHGNETRWPNNTPLAYTLPADGQGEKKRLFPAYCITAALSGRMWRARFIANSGLSKNEAIWMMTTMTKQLQTGFRRGGKGAMDPAPAAIFYVAPDGDDGNPGSLGMPLATIQAARDVARQVEGPTTILLAPGAYFNADTIVLDDRDSGLTIKGSAPGAGAKVYGGIPVTGWKKWKGDIWRAPVPKGERFFNLIVDGKPATMAQTPNDVLTDTVQTP